MATLRRLRLAFVRHGESLNNVLEAQSEELYRKQRSHDPSVSDLGRRQAQSVADWFADKGKSTLVQPVHQLWCSPVLRTMQTASPIAKVLSLRPQVHLDIFEAGGIYTLLPDGGAEGHGGLTRSEMEREFPDYVLPDGVTDKGWYPVAQGREEPEACVERAKRVAERFIAYAKELTADQNVCVVAHYDLLCALMDALLDPQRPRPPPLGNTTHFVRWRFYNASITMVDIYQDGGVGVLMQNSVSHLPADQVVLGDLGFR
eukprot:TRINITY_DN52282_c0_g1_i1.p1 TRINITY_DN52282_c0_g1~~TRINITY_DN52282_c0_g1_i1.p1  ORF type:complete len:286 (+),score=72.13 TRINITY_DN52282_c0_g1_i1:83-859(+)